MATRNITVVNSGMNVCGWTFLIFLVAKLAHFVSWSWWLVTLPLWIFPAMFVTIVIVLLLAALVARVLFGS